MPEEQSFYDHPQVQANYFSHRNQSDNPNDKLERPIFLKLVGDLAHLDIVDLGCGDAVFGKEALLQGAKSYEGIESSEAMVALARQMLAGTTGKVFHEKIERWRSQSEQTDLQRFSNGWTKIRVAGEFP